MKNSQNEESKSHLMVHAESRSKQIFVKVLVVLMVLLSLVLLINHLGFKLDMASLQAKLKVVPERKEPRSPSLSEAEDAGYEFEENGVGKSDTPFAWTYKDYQYLTIGSTTRSQVEEQFGPANYLLKESSDFRVLTYIEENDYGDGDYSPTKQVSLTFRKEGEDYYLIRKSVENMVFPYEPAPEDQRVYKWTQEAFDTLITSTIEAPDSGAAYEEILARYGQPHRISTDEVITETGSIKSMIISYEDTDSEEYIDLSFDKAPDGKYRLRFKHFYDS